jgi:hypothetical protein
VTDNNTNGVWGDSPGVTEQLSAVLSGTNPATAQFDAANVAFGYGTGHRCAAQAATTFYQYPCVLGTLPVEVAKDNTIHAYRWTAWPGNISSVQIGLVARSQRAGTGSYTAADLSIPALLNRSAQGPATFEAWYAALQPKGHKRIALTTTVRPVNMAITSLYWD